MLSSAGGFLASPTNTDFFFFALVTVEDDKVDDGANEGKASLLLTPNEGKLSDDRFLFFFVYACATAYLFALEVVAVALLPVPPPAPPRDGKFEDVKLAVEFMVVLLEA